MMAITEELAGPSLLWGPRGREQWLLNPLGRRMEARPSKAINQRANYMFIKKTESRPQ